MSSPICSKYTSYFSRRIDIFHRHVVANIRTIGFDCESWFSFVEHAELVTLFTYYRSTSSFTYMNCSLR